MRLQRDTNLSENSMRMHKDDGKKKPTRYFSDKQEKAVARVIGGRQTANSGATAYSKGDVTTGDRTGWLIECKTKTSDCESISVKKEWFDKNLSESIFMKKDYNAVVINFGPNSKNYYCIDEQTFVEMKEALDEKRMRGE